MLQIGKIYLEYREEQTRLCADISMNGRGTTLWFGVNPEQGAYLCAERSDAFVMALLPTAMREGKDLCCETPLSERLHYQLEHYLIPTLASAGDLYHHISIEAPLTNRRLHRSGAVGTGFSGGVDRLYSIITPGTDSAYPLTHLAVFHTGVFEGANLREDFHNSCADARNFADEMGLEPVELDSNLSDTLQERFWDVCSFRNLAGALALQNLFSVYFHHSAQDPAQFSLDLHKCDSYDLLSVHCAQTETLTVYLSAIAETEDAP